jgi:Ni,Fe-hydrogenase III small subunit
LFAQSKAINREFLNKYKVDLWLPGTPTHPMTFIDGVMNLLRLKQR